MYDSIGNLQISLVLDLILVIIVVIIVIRVINSHLFLTFLSL